MALLEEKDKELARRLAALEEAENRNSGRDEHDESLAIELAEREREIIKIKKVGFFFDYLKILISETNSFISLRFI